MSKTGYTVVEYNLVDNKISAKGKKVKDSSDPTNWHLTFLTMANTLGDRSHCISKKVGAIITKDSRIISTGINGTPAGLLNCCDLFSPDFLDPSKVSNEDQLKLNKDLHHAFSTKYEIHAEANALLIAAKNGIALEGSTLYVNYSPCRECAKSILAAGISSVVFRYFYLNDLLGFVFLVKSLRLEKIIQIVEDKDYSRNGFDAYISGTLNDINSKLDWYLGSVHPFLKK